MVPQAFLGLLDGELRELVEGDRARDAFGLRDVLQGGAGGRGVEVEDAVVAGIRGRVGRWVWTELLLMSITWHRSIAG